MPNRYQSTLSGLVGGVIGAEARDALFDIVFIDPALMNGGGGVAGRAKVAMALNLVLMHGLLQRTPMAAAYAEDVRRAGGRITVDHGAMRTVCLPGDAPGSGEAAFTRILAPLGYVLAGVYPLDALRMTGRAYVHDDLRETIPQFFLSELHVDRFPPAFQEAAGRVFGGADDGLPQASDDLLKSLGTERTATIELVEAGLPGLVALFGRRHDIPALTDYELLLAESAEAAWIATEGNVFNHVTDRVADVEAVAERQRALRRPVKAKVEVSGSGRVRQTAFQACPVERAFRTETGIALRTVPGSFYEFISRDALPGGGLDLRFDSANAQGIFKMTAAAA